MQQTTFTKLNTAMAWAAFAIAATVYWLTVEPTASLWDCPEFITCSYKLEIGHPPGAPFFMLVANAFSQLANRQITNENQRKTSEKPTKIQRKSSENQRKTNQKLYKSGESGNIQPLPPLLLPLNNCFIYRRFA